MEYTLKLEHKFNDPTLNMSDMNMGLMAEYFTIGADDDVTLY